MKDKTRKRKWFVFLGITCITILSWFALSTGEAEDSSIVLGGDQIEQIPRGEVHWHPRLSITIDGNNVSIPTGIGIDVGRKVDTPLSGMRMSPTHTHESDGTIHIENKNPRSKPETLTLGYFLYVWDKQFNSTCIFEYCTDKGTLSMVVNGKENSEFQNYMMHDKDEIHIEYTSDTNK